MSSPKPVAFEITRVGENKPEQIRADSADLEGDPQQYVFRKDGKIVEQLFAHALQRVPKPVFPQTREDKAAWKSFVAESNAVASQIPQLDRS